MTGRIIRKGAWTYTAYCKKCDGVLVADGEPIDFVKTAQGVIDEWMGSPDYYESDEVLLHGIVRALVREYERGREDEKQESPDYLSR